MIAIRIGLTPENPDSPSTLAVTHHIHQVWNPWRVKGGIVTNFPFLVRYLRLMFDQHAFSCFVLFSNTPFPCVNSMYFIHAYSSRLPYMPIPRIFLTCLYLMYITCPPYLCLIPFSIYSSLQSSLFFS